MTIVSSSVFALIIKQFQNLLHEGEISLTLLLHSSNWKHWGSKGNSMVNDKWHNALCFKYLHINFELT